MTIGGSAGPKRRAWHRRGALVATALLLAATFLVTYLKGFNTGMQVWGEFYWYVDYSLGFIRRGLVGTLVWPIRAAMLPFGHGAFNAVMVGLYHAVSAVALAALPGWLLFSRLRDLGPRPAFWAIAGAAVFCASPAVAIAGYNSGYIDNLLMLLALLGALAIARSRFWLATAIGTAAALVNEAAVFLWMPLGLLVVCGPDFRMDRKAWLPLLAAAAPLVGIAAILAFETGDAARRLIESLHFGDDMKRTLIEMQYGQSAAGQVRTQLAYLADYTFGFSVSALVTQPATLAIAIAAVLVQTISGARLFASRWGVAAPSLAFAFAPFSLLVFSWDLSRMMAWTNYSAAMLLLLSVLAAAKAGEPAPRRGGLRHRFAGGLLAATFLACLGAPMFYSYFQSAALRTGALPSALYDHSPLSAWSAVAVAYQPGDYPDLAQPRDLSCDLTADGAERQQTGTACSHRLAAGSAVHGPKLSVREGIYAATYRYAAEPGCAAGRVRLEAAGGGRILAGREAEIAAPAEVALEFEVRGGTVLSRDLRLHAAALDGCLVLDALDVRRLATR